MEEQLMQKKRNLLILVFALWPLVLLFKVWLIHATGLVPYRVLAWLTFAVFIIIWNYAIRKQLRVLMFTWVISLVIAVCLLFTDWNEQLFLGKVIGSEYVADAPGYSETTFYAGGTCRIRYGGILGDTDVFYCSYEIVGPAIPINNETNTADLSCSTVTINGANYLVKVNAPAP